MFVDVHRGLKEALYAVLKRNEFKRKASRFPIHERLHGRRDVFFNLCASIFELKFF
jgi:hypothetical protein